MISSHASIIAQSTRLTDWFRRPFLIDGQMAEALMIGLDATESD
jgi:hypothetical protein